MTYAVAVMYAVATVLLAGGVYLLARLRAPSLSERKTYAFRMVGIMLASAGVVLAMSATAMLRWSTQI